MASKKMKIDYVMHEHEKNTDFTRISALCMNSKIRAYICHTMKPSDILFKKTFDILNSVTFLQIFEQYQSCMEHSTMQMYVCTTENRH